MRVKENKEKGFTLLETLLYLGLFSIIIGGGMVAAYQIIQGTQANYNHVVLQEEANFIFRKISWAMTGADQIIPGAAETKLTIKKPDPIAPDPITLDFDLVDNKLKLSKNGGDAVDLNSESISVDSLVFNIEEPPVGGLASLEIDFSLSTAQAGRQASQDFSFIKYLRQ